jgi:hypothetical protein
MLLLTPETIGRWRDTLAIRPIVLVEHPKIDHPRPDADEAIAPDDRVRRIIHHGAGYSDS